MRKRTHFDPYRGTGWPDPAWLAPYFLTASGRREFFAGGNDSWGLKVEGVDGTEHLPPAERIDIDLTILGNREGVLLFYHRMSAIDGEAYYSKGDLRKLHMWIKTAHGDIMPVGLFIPFETAWKAVKEFIETDGALPKSIAWVAGRELPADAFPGPFEFRPDLQE